MLVTFERIGSAEHHENGEHVPLHLKPSVRAVTERIAEHRVAGAQDTGCQHEKVTDVADLFVELVDGLANGQKWTHRSPSRGRHQGTPIVSTSIASAPRVERAEP